MINYQVELLAKGLKKLATGETQLERVETGEKTIWRITPKS